MRYIGKAGQAAQVKALVNMVMNINTAGLAEGLGLADALKLDLKVVAEVFSARPAQTRRVLATDGEDMINRDHSCFFSGAHAAKDSGIALALGKQQKLSLPLAAATFAQFTKMTKARPRRARQERHRGADLQRPRAAEEKVASNRQRSVVSPFRFASHFHRLTDF